MATVGIHYTVYDLRYIYIYIYIVLCVYVCKYIYMYVCRQASGSALAFANRVADGDAGAAGGAPPKKRKAKMLFAEDIHAHTYTYNIYV